jgi:L-fucose mutarotase/ribose pyranase (RbsD/FucU family)
MCNIYEFGSSKLIRDGCTRCMIDCYRDPSVLQFVAISASDAYNNLKKGKVIAAAKVGLELRPIEKWDFYKAVETNDHVLTIQTADQQRFANILLTVGVRMD